MIHSKYPGRAVFLLAFLPLMLTAQKAQQVVVPLKNWATPLYWQPNLAESKAGGLQPRGDAPASTVPTFLTFVAMTPCRLVDTRGESQGFIGASPFNGGSIPAGLPVTTFLLQSTAEAATTGPAPCNPLPTIAAAYSLNLTVVPHAGGPVNFVQIWPAGDPQPTYVSTANDLQGEVVANAAIVAVGPYNGFSVFNYGPATTDVIIDINGYFASPTDAVNGNTAIGTLTMTSNTTGYGNVAIGGSALELNTTGGYNTATGIYSLQSNTIGTSNTASGQAALQNNTQGNNNTADGSGALQLNTIGLANTASGYQALMNNTASYNTASGSGALLANTVGGYNTAAGYNALGSSTSGSANTAFGEGALSANQNGANNIGLGTAAGSGAPVGNSYSIYIGSNGTGGDLAGVIQIGNEMFQTGGTSIAGIFNGTPDLASITPVCVDQNGLLGTTGCTGGALFRSATPSSLRFKEQVADMGDSSDKLLQLRPVTFFYKPRYDDGSHALQYGLIAEEVAKLYPEMVGYDKAGQPSSVNYQSLSPMLLNELQKQAAQVRSLEERMAAMEALLDSAPEPVR